MIVLAGLVLLLAAVVVGVAGVLANGGAGHELTHGFAVFGYHVTGSTGTLFLYGIVVGAIALLGLALLLAGARRTSRRGRAARQGLKQSRLETDAAIERRDDLVRERDAARAGTEGRPSGGRWTGGFHPRGATVRTGAGRSAEMPAAESAGEQRP